MIVPPPLTPLTEIPVANQASIQAQYGQDPNLQALCQDHEGLIKTILEEEEDLISTHRGHIDNVVESVK